MMVLLSAVATPDLKKKKKNIDCTSGSICQEVNGKASDEAQQVLVQEGVSGSCPRQSGTLAC